MVTPNLILLVLVAVGSFALGVLVGWVFSDHAEVDTSSKLKTMVAVAITLGWLATTIAGIALATYTVSPLIHGLMGAIVGYFFTKDGINFTVGGQK